MDIIDRDGMEEEVDLKEDYRILLIKGSPLISAPPFWTQEILKRIAFTFVKGLTLWEKNIFYQKICFEQFLYQILNEIIITIGSISSMFQ